MTQRSWSLRRRLIILLAALAFAAWGAGSVWLYRAVEKQAGQLFDAALAEAAHGVFAAIAHEGLGRKDDFDFEPEEHGHVEKLFYQLRDRRGTIVYSSPGSPRDALADGDAKGFTERIADGTAYRVYTVRASESRAAIHVGQRLTEREALVRSMALRLLLPGMVVVILLAAGTWIIVRRVTSPVVSFSQAIDARAPTDSGPVAVGNLPEELRPVAHAVNRLLERVEAALMRERTLTADAAHELRTPLAALRAQAQVALRAGNEGERSEALQALIGGVDRATRLVETVLTLARLDARSFDRAALSPVSLDDVAAEAVEALRAHPRGRSVRIEVDMPALSIRADRESLPIALRNLGENALRHAASRVRIEAHAEDTELTITVRDDGPGMTEDQRARAFDRFYRAATDGAGAGLGLALVRRVAELHEGSVHFTAGLDGKGLGVELVLPGAAAG